MKISFNTPGRRWLVVVLPGRALAAVASLQPVGGILVRSRAADLTSQPAAWLDPGMLSQSRKVLILFPAIRRGSRTSPAATELNPSARYWFDLASAYQVLGDTSVRQTPWNTPSAGTHETGWVDCRKFLPGSSERKGAQEFRVVLANDATLAAAAIQLCGRIQPDVDLRLRDVVPPKGDA
jgi:hypothetical protein